MLPQDNEDDDDTPKIFRMFIGNEEMQNHPELMLMLQMLMNKLIAHDLEEDMPEFTGDRLISSNVNTEMFRLEVLDDEVVGSHFPHALDLIMNAYRKHEND